MHANKPFQAKSLPSRGTKGTMLSVIRINACVVKDHGSSISEPRLQAKSKDRPSSRSMRSHSGVSDKNTVTEGNWYKRGQEYDLHSGHKFKYSINIPSDHVRTQDELALHMGEWYYMDGAGRELGPYVFSELKDLVSKNVILEHSVVFRKADNTWVQISKTAVATESIQNNERTLENVKLTNKETDVFFPFHDLHPQFIGFMCGKLHELVMKSYKSREFAAAINGVLDPWLNANQPKELDMHFSFKSAKSSSVFSHGLSSEKLQRSEEDYPGVYNYSAKRPRLINDGIIEDYDMDSSYCLKNDYSFEDLCTDDVPIDANFSAQSENWGLLNYRILGRIFHFLRDDTKSLLFSAATCKHWKKVVGFYKSISKYVDFSSAGPSLADNMFQNIMKGYDSNKLTTIILSTCTNVSSSSLGEVIRSFPGISSINIRGCNQFRELVPMFQHVRWIESQNSFSTRYLEDPYSKARSLKQITEKSYSIAKSFILEAVEQGTAAGNPKMSSELLYGLLNALLEAGDMRRANGLLARYRLVLREEGNSILLYNLLMKGYTHTEFPLGALAVRDEVLRNGLKPDKLTYNTLIFACVKSGRMDAAFRLFSEMKEEARKGNDSKLNPSSSCACSQRWKVKEN